MSDTLAKLREAIEGMEEVDWQKFANLQALEVVEHGRAFAEEMIELINGNDGSQRYGKGVKSVEFNPDGSVSKVEFHEGGSDG